MRQTTRSVTIGISAVTLVLSLMGCSAEPELTSPDPAPASAAPDSPSPSTQPAVEPVVQPAGCDTVLTEAGMADLTADNLKPVDFEVQPWDYPLVSDMDQAGIVCKWAGGGDVFVVLGQLPMDEQTWHATRADLEAAGYELDESHGIEGFINGPDGEDETYPTRGFAWRSGILYYASYTGILEFVPAFQG